MRPMISQNPSRLWLIGVALSGLGAFANSLSNGFVLDDLSIIVSNPLIRSLSNLPRIFSSHYWYPELQSGDLYRPLTVATYALNYAAGGLNPWGYHTVNVLLHVGCSCLVFLLFSRLLASTTAAGVAALLFAVHPLHTEAVASVIGRAELLAAGSVLAALYLHSDGRDRLWPSAGAAAVLFAGLLCKENALVFLPLAVLVDFIRGKIRTRARAYVVYGAVVLLFLVVRWVVLGTVLTGDAARIDRVDNPLAAATPAARWMTGLAILARCLRLSLWPYPLSADYSFDQVAVLSSPLESEFLVPVILAIGLLWLSRWFVRNKNREWLLTAGFFFVAFSLTANLLFPIGTMMAERLAYLPSVGICALAGVVYAAFDIRRASRVTAGIGMGLVLAAFLLGTIVRNLDWKDEWTLWSKTVETSPRSVKAHLNFGAALNNRGRYEEAILEYQRALAIKPDYREAFLHLGIAQANLGQPSPAEGSYRKAIALESRYAEAHRRLGQLLLASGRREEAELSLSRAVQLKPVDAEAQNDLGVLLQGNGRHEQAIAHYRKAVELRPDYGEAWNNLGSAHYQLKQLAEAEVALMRASALAAEDPRTWNNLGNVYRALGKKQEAIQSYETFLRLWKGDPRFADIVRQQIRVLRAQE